MSTLTDKPTARTGHKPGKPPWIARNARKRAVIDRRAREQAHAEVERERPGLLARADAAVESDDLGKVRAVRAQLGKALRHRGYLRDGHALELLRARHAALRLAERKLSRRRDRPADGREHKPLTLHRLRSILGGERTALKRAAVDVAAMESLVHKQAELPPHPEELDVDLRAEREDLEYRARKLGRLAACECPGDAEAVVCTQERVREAARDVAELRARVKRLREHRRRLRAHGRGRSGPRRRWTVESVAEAIGRFEVENGRTPTWYELAERPELPSARTVYWHWGDKGLKALDLEALGLEVNNELFGLAYTIARARWGRRELYALLLQDHNVTPAEVNALLELGERLALWERRGRGYHLRPRALAWIEREVGAVEPLEPDQQRAARATIRTVLEP